jgi:hypothetical protein
VFDEQHRVMIAILIVGWNLSTSCTEIWHQHTTGTLFRQKNTIMRQHWPLDLVDLEIPIELVLLMLDRHDQFGDPFLINVGIKEYVARDYHK